MWRLELRCCFHKNKKRQQGPDWVRHVINIWAGWKAGTEAVRWSVKRQKERSPQSVCARDERGVSIWAELRMHAGELLKNGDRSQRRTKRIKTHTKRMKTRWEWLPGPSKHTSNSLRAHTTYTCSQRPHTNLQSSTREFAHTGFHDFL